MAVKVAVLQLEFGAKDALSFSICENLSPTSRCRLLDMHIGEKIGKAKNWIAGLVRYLFTIPGNSSWLTGACAGHRGSDEVLSSLVRHWCRGQSSSCNRSVAELLLVWTD
ncbi:hypothetical protein EJB05_51557, partial [Eragrostis curvula]